MSAFKPPHTPGLAGSALHLRALAPVEHSGHDKPTKEEYKGGVTRVAGVQGAEPARVAWRGAALTRVSRPNCNLLYGYVLAETGENRRLPGTTQARKSVTACSAHSLAEVYAVMTALPVRPLISPDQVLLFVDQIPDKTTIVALNDGEHVSAIRAASELAVVGGRIYDFLLLAAAVRSIRNIYTWNVKHFRDLAPDWEKRARTPKQA